MKLLIPLFIVILYLCVNSVNAQNIGINTDGSNPDSKALLDVKAAATGGLGMLIPRMTWANRPAGLLAAQDGLIIYSTDGDGTNGAGFYYWDGVGLVWKKVGTGILGGSGTTNYLARWTGTNTIGIGVTQDNNSTVGINVAPSASYNLYVSGALAAADNAAIYGASTGNARVYGVLGAISTAVLTSGAAGVRGYAAGTTIDIYGVFGECASANAASAGVRGLATGASGNGVLGQATGDGGYGVYGQNTSTGAGGQYGVRGEKTGAAAVGSNGYGVYGRAIGSGDINYGGYFTASGGTANYGLVVPSGGGNVGIGTTTPSAKSLLQMVSTTSGLLVPNMTQAQRVAIAPAATDYGLLVYQITDVPVGYWYWDGAAWRYLFSGSGSNVRWNEIIDPNGALTLNHSTYLTTFNFANTTANGFDMNFTAATSGNCLTIAHNTSTLTGNALSVSTTSTGAPTNGLVRFNFTGARTAAGVGFQIDDVSTTAATVMRINANSLTTGLGLTISNTGTVLTTAGANTGSLLNIQASGAVAAFTGSLANINFAGTAVANTGALLNINSSGAAQVTQSILATNASTGAPANGLVRFNFTGARTAAGVGFQIDDVSTTLATVMQLNGNALTTGNGLAVSATAAGLTGNALSVTTGATGAPTNGLVRFNFNGARTVAGVGFKIDDISTTLATVMQLNGNSLTTGNGLEVNANALTTGTAVNISSTSTAGNASKLLNLSRSGANAAALMTNYGLYSSITNTGVTSTNVAGYFSASGGTTANNAIIVPSGGGRVGIGTATPSAKSLLQVAGTTGGVLIPNMTRAQKVALAPGATDYGLLVYQTDLFAGPPAEQIGFWYWDGAAWNMFFDNSPPNAAWAVLGNSGTVAGTNYIGTNDVQDFVIKTSAVINTPLERMRITSGGYVGVNVAPSTSYQLYASSALAGADNAAIYGYITGAAQVYGVLGTATSATANASGVRGINNAAGAVNGVWGSTSSITNNAAGVYGSATGASGEVYGVYGLCTSPTIYSAAVMGETTAGGSDAVVGWNSAAAGASDGYGVWGLTSQSTGFALVGNNLNTSGTGVFGVGNNLGGSYLGGGSGGAFSSTNVGVYGYGNNTAASYGVWGVTDNATGIGVEGDNNAAAGAAIGFGGWFENYQTGGAALVGSLGASSYYAGTAVSGITVSTLAGGIGVIGACNNATGKGVQGQTSGTGASTGVVGISSGADIAATGVYGLASGATAGTGFVSTTCRKSVYGQGNSVAGSYKFGVFGDGGTSTRTGGVLGDNYNLSRGALGYYSSASVDIGVYAFGSYSLGAIGGKMLNTGDTVQYNDIGIAAYAGTMGAWIRGIKYGTMLKGEQFSLYVEGKTYTNNFIVQLDNSSDETERIPSYVSTSTSVDIMDKGTAKLVNGKAYIKFNGNFSKVVSEKTPVTVTATPNGKSSGVYVESVTKDGFTVVENNGTSDVQFCWIAIGTKAGYESPVHSSELLSVEFDKTMNGVMYNDADITGSGTPIWWDGFKMRHDTPPSIFTDRKPVESFVTFQTPSVLDKSRNGEKILIEN
ncbi:MAG: hypothetical protein HY958_10485, partial [Bacteroidia bacterium]|nr:hypothetical protein [Bacteroidia bacterium]